MTEPQPIRVGVAGLSPSGRHLLERLSLRPHCELLLFQQSGTPLDVQAQSLGISTITNWRRFLSDSELNAVLFLDGCSLDRSQVQDALGAGLPVGVLPPLAAEVLEWEEFPITPPAKLATLNPHHDDADFRAAQTWMRSTGLEPFASIKRISWVADLIRPAADAFADVDSWFAQLLWEDLDQLLRLVEKMPTSVYAAEFSEERQHYFLMLKFPAGVTGHLERRRGSLAPLDLGWTISSGYAKGQQYIKTEAGEIYDLPMEQPAGQRDFGYDPLAALNQPDLENSWNHALDALILRSAILDSAASNQVILMAD